MTTPTASVSGLGSRPRVADEVFLPEDTVLERVEELAGEVSAAYAGRPLVVVCVLRASFVFCADLCRSLSVGHELGFIALDPYDGSRSGARSTVQLLLDLDVAVDGRDVLVVEGIVDTGLTLNHVVGLIEQRQPASVEVCVLLDRPARRLIDDLPLSFVGFTVPDELFAGYGLGPTEADRRLRDLHVTTDEQGSPSPER